MSRPTFTGFTFTGFAACLGFLVFVDWARGPGEEVGALDDALAQPKLIQQIDGCQVYRFRDLGQTHYFTRCAARVETETSQRECSHEHTLKCSTRSEFMQTTAGR